jgi:hypothetical protein
MAFMIGFSRVFYADAGKTLPLINTDDTDREKTTPLKRGGTEEAEKILTTEEHGLRSGDLVIG